MKTNREFYMNKCIVSTRCFKYLYTLKLFHGNFFIDP